MILAIVYWTIGMGTVLVCSYAGQMMIDESKLVPVSKLKWYSVGSMLVVSGLCVVVIIHSLFS